MNTKTRGIVVYHTEYGCDTGCCGHTVQYVDKTDSSFQFDHPGENETDIEFAKRLIREEFGEDHVKDLDWENCTIGCN